MRVTLTAMLGTTRIPMQVDVGTGDAVVPPPETIDYPGLLALPVELPIALTDDFALDMQKQNQWRAFSGRLRDTISTELGDVVAPLREFLWPAVVAADADTEWPARWLPGGPWSRH